MPPSRHCARSNCRAEGERCADAALEVADIVRLLDADDDVVAAAMIQPLLDAGYLEREAAAKRFGDEPLRLARALSQLGEFGLPADWAPERGLEAAQAEALRKMLLAVIGDVRLVVVRLAQQLQRMRSAKRRRARRGSASSRLRLARCMRRSPIASGCGR